MNLRQIPIRITAVTANCMLCVMLCMPAALTAASAKDGPKIATMGFSKKVTDGNSWNVSVTGYPKKVEMTLFPDGSGITNDSQAPTPKWRPTVDGLCLRPSGMTREHCFTLVARSNGYDGIENGELYIEFRR